MLVLYYTMLHNNFKNEVDLLYRAIEDIGGLTVKGTDNVIGGLCSNYG